MLSLDKVIPYLCERGVLEPHMVVDRGVRVFDASRRNHNYKVVQGDGAADLFVKQGHERDGFSGVRREAHLYALLGAASGDLRSYRHIPPYVDYDQEADVLVIELVEDAVDLRRAETGRSTCLTRAAAGLGQALAALHRGCDVESALERVGDGQPGVLDAQRPGLALLRDFSAAGIDLVRLLQTDVDLLCHLDGLQAGWRSDALIHHDVRLDNVLYQPGRHAVTLVDWETAAVGDAAWDLGSAVGDYLGLWLMSIPGSPGQPPHESLHLARRPLTGIQPSVIALFDAYCADAGVPPDQRADLAFRVAQYAGLKLLQSAIEQVQNAPRWTLAALCHLQVAANILARPQQGAELLLGLRAAA